MPHVRVPSSILSETVGAAKGSFYLFPFLPPLFFLFWRMVMLIRKHRVVAHTLERAFEREDLAIRDAEPLLHRPLADIRDPRRAASPRQMQRSRIPLSSPMSECIY